MSDATAVKRQLTIKTGVVKRLTKEEKSYAKEVVQQRERIEKYIRDGKDEWDVKKQREVLQDCLQMLPDCRKRLLNAVTDLQNVVDALEPSLSESDEAKSARETLESAAASMTEAGEVA